MFRVDRRAGLAFSLVILGGCTKQEHPDGATQPVADARQVGESRTSHDAAATHDAGVAREASDAARTAPSSDADAHSDAAPDGGTHTQLDAGAQEAATIDVPLLDADGGSLPQTEEQPKTDSASFKRRIQLLVDAIVKDDAKLALPAFFPVIAYKQVKAVASPELDWQRRLVSAFEKDIHEYHRSLGKNAAAAKLESVEVPEKAVKWMKRGSEGNRLGYFRVLRSRLKLRVEERVRELEITSMISWRGEWYVVHLNGFD